jgi:hypothetical protein
MSKTKKQSITLPAVKETEKLTTAEEITERLSHQIFTLEHIKRSTEHIRELSLMLDEARDGGTNGKHLQYIAMGVQNMVDVYANEIDECMEYFEKLVRVAGALRKGGAK